MSSRLSPYRLGKAREVFNYFNIFNSLSWNLLVGIIITLFALRLGATPSYIGLLTATFYASLFCLPLGKVLANRFSIIGIYSAGWMFRSIGMVFAVAAPVFFYAGNHSMALVFLMTGIVIFQFFRGIGMIGNNPVLNQLAAGPDRGSYLTQIQILNSAIGMFSSFFVAMVLGTEPPLFIFSILLGIGVVTGIISGILIKRIPEPPKEKESSKKLIEIFKYALTQDSLRSFMLILFLVALVSGVMRAFITVYAREVFIHNDGLISLYSVFGGLGFLLAGFCVKFLVDRVGAKPLFLVCVIVGTASIVPVIFFPVTASVTASILFMVFIFFMLNFGFLGSEGIAQTYFLALIPKDMMLDLGILYFFIFGVAGAGGSLLSGVFIDLIIAAGVPSYISYRILFGLMIALSVFALAMQKKMKPLDSLSLTGALEVIFSFRDLRAINILDKLNKAEDSQEEEQLIGELHDTPSHLAVDGLLERARSPRLATRMESIRAFEKMKRLNETAKKALTEDIINNPYTTAYISARILGDHHYSAAIPMLRELTLSDDYMLAGESMVALAKMKDEEFRPEIEKLIGEKHNPRFKIMGAEALGRFKNVNSIPVLLDILRTDNPPPYLRDEVVLAIASILDIQRFYYKLLVRYRTDNSLALDLAMDETESTFEHINATLNGKRRSLKDRIESIKSLAGSLMESVRSYIKDSNGTPFSKWLLEFPEENEKNKTDIGFIKAVLSEIVIDNDLSSHGSLCLLIVQWASRNLRTLAAKVK